MTAIWIILLPALLGAGAFAGVLDGLAKPRDYTSHRESSYDRTGGNADGCQGNGIKPGEVRTILDVRCAGEIAHMWFTFDPYEKDTLSDTIIRMYWDDEASPSVECPIGAFFGQGHGRPYSFDSLCVSVGNDAGLNCFWPMPFKKHAVVTIENQAGRELRMFYYQIDYKQFAKPQQDLLYFHAQYRQAKPELSPENYVALDATGRGHYVGMFYYIRANSPDWWGEGDDMIFIDGEKWPPSLHGTGMEDYFCHAWGMKEGQCYERYGAPLFEVHKFAPGNENTAYRWHIEDAITFTRSIRVTHEHGSENDRNDDFSSVAFWYQTHPHAAFPPLPSKFERLSFADKKQALLKEKKFAECRAMLEDFAKRAVDTEAAAYAQLDIAETYAAEGLKDKAVEVLAPYIGPIPMEGWSEKAMPLVERLGLKELIADASRSPSDPKLRDASRSPSDPKLTDIWIVSAPDGRPIPDKAGGSRCFRTDTAGKSLYLYFKVHNKSLRNATKDLVLEVEYHSPGSGTVQAQYNSAFEEDDLLAKYHPADPAPMDPQTGWHTAKIALPNARLRGQQNSEADFRLLNSDGDLSVRKVTITEGR